VAEEPAAGAQAAVARFLSYPNLTAEDRGDEQTAQEMRQLSDKMARDEKEHQTAIKEAKENWGFVPAALQPQPWQSGSGKRKLGTPKPKFTTQQGQLLAFIHCYTVLRGISPSEKEIEKFFGKHWRTVSRSLRKLKHRGLSPGLPGG
jgi:hypothetical protein